MEILSIERAENNLIDAEIVRRDAVSDFAAHILGSGARVRAAEALLRRRRAEFDAAFVATLCVGLGEAA